MRWECVVHHSPEKLENRDGSIVRAPCISCRVIISDVLLDLPRFLKFGSFSTGSRASAICLGAGEWKGGMGVGSCLGAGRALEGENHGDEPLFTQVQEQEFPSSDDGKTEELDGGFHRAKGTAMGDLSPFFFLFPLFPFLLNVGVPPSTPLLEIAPVIGHSSNPRGHQDGRVLTPSSFRL